MIYTSDGKLEDKLNKQIYITKCHKAIYELMEDIYQIYDDVDQLKDIEIIISTKIPSENVDIEVKI